MDEFGQKSNISDEGFMIYILINFPEDYDVILKGLENCLTVTRDNAPTIDMIHKKLNHW